MEWEKSGKNYSQMANRKTKIQTFLNGLKNLLGVGVYLLLIGLSLEIITVAVHKYVSIPITIPIEWKYALIIICVILCVSGMIWLNRTLDLIGIHVAGGENILMTHGPFNFVRHPLYGTLIITLPPILIIWLEDVLFIIPWIFIYVIAKNVIKIEERGLVRIFGEEYEKYREFVPDLIPYKGSGGKRFRKYYEKINNTG
jgi:protein-S-isoprenylcysteine O-methyltransferase Ste14